MGADVGPPRTLPLFSRELYNAAKKKRKTPALRVTCSLVRLQISWGFLPLGLEQSPLSAGREIPGSGPTLLRDCLSNDCRRTVAAGVFIFLISVLDRPHARRLTLIHPPRSSRLIEAVDLRIVCAYLYYAFSRWGSVFVRFSFYRLPRKRPTSMTSST